MPLVTDRDKCAHLLRRFGLGASEAEVDFYLRDGLNGAIDRLLGYSTVDEGFTLDIETLRNPKDDKLNMPAVVNWWTVRLLVTQRPLQERMTAFWHNHFATSASKVGAPMMMLAQNEIFRRNATGNFRKLLLEASQDPAMILWLDNQQNVKGHANENFAREVMELFTLGIGHYTEKDVQEGARAFTGWSLQRQGGKKGTAEFRFNRGRHDAGMKNYLGQEGPFEGEDILNILCGEVRTSEFLVQKIWEWFVYPSPAPSTVTRFAEKFRSANLDIGSLLKDIMRSSEFYSPKAERAVVKSPLDFCVGTMRQMGIGKLVSEALTVAPAGQPPRQAIAPAAAAQQTMKAMGMALLYPPDVSGWKTGQAWITSATMVERIAWGDRLFGQSKAGRFQVRFRAFPLLGDAPTPQSVVATLLGLFDASMKPDRQAILFQAAEKASPGPITPRNANAVCAAVARLMFASPEFQFE